MPTPWPAARAATPTLRNTPFRIRSQRIAPHPESLLSAEEREELRRQRIAAAKRGKPRPRHVVEAMAKGRRGKPQSPATRAKMRAARLAYLERKRSNA